MSCLNVIKLCVNVRIDILHTDLKPHWISMSNMKNQGHWVENCVIIWMYLVLFSYTCKDAKLHKNLSSYWFESQKTRYLERTFGKCHVAMGFSALWSPSCFILQTECRWGYHPFPVQLQCRFGCSLLCTRSETNISWVCSRLNTKGQGHWIRNVYTISFCFYFYRTYRMQPREDKDPWKLKQKVDVTRGKLPK